MGLLTGAEDVTDPVPGLLAATGKVGEGVRCSRWVLGRGGAAGRDGAALDDVTGSVRGREAGVVSGGAEFKTSRCVRGFKTGPRVTRGCVDEAGGWGLAEGETSSGRADELPGGTSLDIIAERVADFA
jgi:hypothetical protein